MSHAIYECPKCGKDVQDPLLHNVYSSCNGAVEWRGSELYCIRCDTRITTLGPCDFCGYKASIREAVR